MIADVQFSREAVAKMPWGDIHFAFQRNSYLARVEFSPATTASSLPSSVVVSLPRNAANYPERLWRELVEHRALALHQHGLESGELLPNG